MSEHRANDDVESAVIKPIYREQMALTISLWTFTSYMYSMWLNKFATHNIICVQHDNIHIIQYYSLFRLLFLLDDNLSIWSHHQDMSKNILCLCAHKHNCTRAHQRSVWRGSTHVQFHRRVRSRPIAMWVWTVNASSKSIGCFSSLFADFFSHSLQKKRIDECRA